MRFLRDVHAAVAELERQRYLQVVGEDAGFVSAPVAVGVLEDDQLVVRLVAGINVRVSRRATDPQPAATVPAHLDRAGQIGELLLGGEQVHLEARIHVERAQLVLRRQQIVGAPALGRAGERRQIRVVGLGQHLFALGQAPYSLVAVGRHEVEVSHRWQEVEIAVTAIASAGIIKRVHRPEAAEELFVLLQNRSSNLLIGHRRLGVECRLENRLGKQPIAVVVQVAAVERQVVPRRCHRLFGDRKKIDEADPLRRRDVAHGLCVKPDIRVVDGGVDALDIFVGDRREQHESRAGFAVERLGLGRRDVVGKVAAKLGQAAWPGE